MRTLNRHKVAKRFVLSFGDASLGWARRHDAMDAEAALDGLYVIRTSLQARKMDAPDCVRSYKALANVERAFRTMKTVDLKVRSIHPWLADRVRAHVLLRMLACYVERHMRGAWRALMFAGTAQAASKHPDDGEAACSFATLMVEIATLVRNPCHTPNAASDAPNFEVLTTAIAHQ